MPMTMAEQAPTRDHAPTSTGLSPRRATIVAPPPTMTMKKEPGGGRRSAFCRKAPIVAIRAVKMAGSASHRWLAPAERWLKATEPTKAPETEARAISPPATVMTRQRVR
ncbi:hypothetical protein [Corynebacterium frankenforstense]